MSEDINLPNENGNIKVDVMFEMAQYMAISSSPNL